MNWQIVVSVIFFIGGVGNLFTDFAGAVFGIVGGAAFLYWGLKRKKPKKKERADSVDRSLKEETFRAVGVSYYEDNIKKLATVNTDWTAPIAEIVKAGKAGRRIFKYKYVNKPVYLREDPKNPHDKNAVAVIVAGELVGYISREENVFVREILKNHEVKSISSFIGGGEYKTVTEDGDVVSNEYGYSVTVRVKYV